MGSKADSAAALAAPEVVAAEDVAAAAKRFWGGLIDALGKDAYEETTVRVGRKVVLRSRRVFGQERTIDRRGPQKIVSTRRAVARWELVPLVLVGSAAAAYAASKTPDGSAAWAELKGKLPKKPTPESAAKSWVAWMGPFKPPLL